MPGFDVLVSGFDGAPINGPWKIQISKRRLLKFAITTGVPVFAAGSVPTHVPVALASYKALALKCAMDFSGPTLDMAPGYPNMDPTEQANVSYWTGMTLAALIADEILQVPRLLHAAAYRGLVRVNPVSRELADLIGQDASGDWHVIEAKARKSFGPKDRWKWKGQANSIAMINGSAPTTESYSLVRVAKTYSGELVDPPVEEAGRFLLEIDPMEFAERYYGPIARWIADGGVPVTLGGVPLVARLAAFDAADLEYVWIGAIPALLEHSEESFTTTNAVDLEDAYIGSDGIAVITIREAHAYEQAERIPAFEASGQEEAFADRDRLTNR
jgi:hypothetical protein